MPESASGWVAVRDSYGGGGAYVLGHTFAGTRRDVIDAVLASWAYYLDHQGMSPDRANRIKWLHRKHGYRFVKAEVRCIVADGGSG